MAAKSRAVSVGTTATRIDTEEGGFSAAAQGTAIYNAGAATVYLGGSDVTTSAGYPLGVGEHIGIDLAQGDKLYGLVASGTVEVRVLEVGV